MLTTASTSTGNRKDVDFPIWNHTFAFEANVEAAVAVTPTEMLSSSAEACAIAKAKVWMPEPASLASQPISTRLTSNGRHSDEVSLGFVLKAPRCQLAVESCQRREGGSIAGAVRSTRIS